MTTPLIEAIARAIAEGQGDDFDHAHRDKPHWIETRGESGGRYRDINEPRQPDFIDAAQAAITALTDAGYAVVPVEPTKAMISAGISVAEDVEDWTRDTNESYRVDCASDYPFPIYRAMINAALDSEKGE